MGSSLNQSGSHSLEWRESVRGLHAIELHETAVLCGLCWAATRLRLLVTALDVQLQASRETVEISGSVPLIDSSDYADLVTTERTSASPLRGDQIDRVPFSLSVPIH